MMECNYNFSQKNFFNVELVNKNHYEVVKFIPTYGMQTQQKNCNNNIKKFYKVCGIKTNNDNGIIQHTI